MRRAERLAVEITAISLSIFCCRLSSVIRCPEPVLIGALLFVALHAPLQPVLACGASLPSQARSRRNQVAASDRAQRHDHQPNDQRCDQPIEWS